MLFAKCFDSQENRKDPPCRYRVRPPHGKVNGRSANFFIRIGQCACHFVVAGAVGIHGSRLLYVSTKIGCLLKIGGSNRLLTPIFL